jgi:AraC-like DNA-binding protein
VTIHSAAVENTLAPPVVWKGGRAQVAVHTRISDSMLRAEELGSLLLISMRCGTVTISRPAGAATAADRVSTFILMLSGQATLRHYGRQVVLLPGDITAYDHSADYSLRYDQPAQVIMVRVPSVHVRQLFPMADNIYGQRLAGDVGLTSTAMAMAVDLSRKPGATRGLQFQDRAARHLLEMLATAYAEALDDSAESSAMPTRRLWRVRLYIEENLRDPDLCPGLVAERLKLSGRYLRMVFSISDESPSAYILRRRLEEIAGNLRDQRWRGRSITEIAFGWGFNSAPHFTRAFRQMFGMTPSEYRQRNLGAAGHAGSTQTAVHDNCESSTDAASALRRRHSWMASIT